MAVHCKRPQLWRHLTVANTMTALGLALWLIPIGMYFLDASDTIVMIVVNFVAAVGLAMFTGGLVWRSQQRNQRWRDQYEHTTARRHNELVLQHTADREAMYRLITSSQKIADDALANIHRQVNAIAGRLDRGAWDIYADAITDVAGGPEVVNGETTQQLSVPGGNVVRLRRSARRN